MILLPYLLGASKPQHASIVASVCMRASTKSVRWLCSAKLSKSDMLVMPICLAWRIRYKLILSLPASYHFVQQHVCYLQSDDSCRLHHDVVVRCCEAGTLGTAGQCSALDMWRMNEQQMLCKLWHRISFGSDEVCEQWSGSMK